MAIQGPIHIDSTIDGWIVGRIIKKVEIKIFNETVVMLK